MIYKELRADIGQIIKKLCEEKKVEILEAQACPDHIHMLVSIPTIFKCSTVYRVSQEQECPDDI